MKKDCRCNMAKKISVIKIIEMNENLDIIFIELQKKIGYDTELDNHKQLIRMLFKLLDTEITNYVKTEDEENFSNALKISSLLEKITSACVFSENDAHLHLYKQARLLIKITGLIGEFLNENIEANLIFLKEKIDKIQFQNEKKIERKFKTQIIDLEQALIIKRFLKLVKENETQKAKEQLDENYKLFLKIINKCLESIENQNENIYYYLYILRILKEKIGERQIYPLYAEKISKLKALHLPQKYQIILNELENILKKKKNKNTTTDVLHKYEINLEQATKISNCPENFQILSYKEIESVALSIDGSGKDTIKDDALSVKREKDGYVLGIHIADVGNFIIPNSPLDLNAKQRYKSLYLADQVIHMISPAISKQYLSLEEGEKRNVISLYVKINKTGEIESYYFSAETITVKQNLSYYYADNILRQEITPPTELDYNLKLLEQVTSLLRNSQRNEFQFMKELIKEIATEENPYSEKIVSESMILYNSLFPKYLSNFSDIPTIYRVHDKPQIPNLSAIIADTNLLNKDLFTILNEYYPRAFYSLSNTGHYGLKLDTYSHSSAPIRKYTDLFMQRLYFLSQQQITVDQLKQLEQEAIDFVEYANRREKELKMFEEEYEKAYIKTFKPSEK